MRRSKMHNSICPCARCKSRIAKGQKPAHESPAADPEIVRLVEFAKKPIAFSELCNKLDKSPRATEALLQRARERNAPIHVEHDTVSVAPAPSIEVVADIKISKKVGERVKAGFISDTHLGSKYCLRGALRETIGWMYEQGVRDIFHSGDVLEGCYRHAQYELSHTGFDDQLRDAAKCFPELKGLRYHFISGNHDFTFEEKIGMRCGVAIQQGMEARGRRDWISYGDRNAYVRFGGAVINLWHPRGAPAYARSYNLQKRVEAYTAIKPHILMMGHYHQFAYAYERGIHAIMMPCFQGSGSNFAQSLKGAPAIGGLLLGWNVSETGRLHDFDINPRFFYERDSIFDARNALDAGEISAVGRDHRYK